jgi:hypothetical protein
MESNNNRRNFLKLGTLSLGAAIISPLSTIANTDQTEDSILKMKLTKINLKLFLFFRLLMSIARFIRMRVVFWENGKAVLENWWVCLYGNSIERVEKKIPIPIQSIPVICFKEVN